MDQYLKILRLTSLTFRAKEREEAFLAHYYQASLFHGRLCHMLSIFFFLIDGLRDFFLFPQVLAWTLSLRYGVIVPMFTAGLILSYRNPGIYQRIWQPLFALYFFATGMGVLALTLIIPPPAGQEIYVGLIYCMVFGYTFIRLRFWLASLVGLVLTAGHFVTMFWLLGVGPASLWIQVPFVAGVNLLGMVVAYTMEYNFRKNFYLQELTAHQKKELDRANLTLENQVKQRTRELEASNQRLKIQMEALHTSESERHALEAQLRQAYKMEAIGTLAGGIAHDFNNILFPVLGHTEMLLQDLPRNSPEHDHLTKIYHSAIRARDLVRQILTFSRQDILELNWIKPQPIIQEALSLIRSTLPATIDIKAEISPDCGRIKADPTQIHQIIMNLATNAAHAMEETGGELKVGLEEVLLAADDSRLAPGMAPGVYLCLTLADTGVGMDPALKGKIFDPFFTTKGKGRGTGMGLSVVHGIVSAMGGAIQVESEPGKGSQFFVYFSRKPNGSETEKILPFQPFQSGCEHILLVDDEDEIVTMEKRILERLGYQVTARTSSLDALETFQAGPEKFDLVLTDLAMPQMSGDKLAAQLIRLRPDIPILLCTGFSETMSQEKAISLGIKGFLLKPIVMKDLSHKIREILDTPA